MSFRLHTAIEADKRGAVVAETPDCEWQGSVEATWEKYVEEVLRKSPTDQVFQASAGMPGYLGESFLPAPLCGEFVDHHTHGAAWHAGKRRFERHREMKALEVIRFEGGPCFTYWFKATIGECVYEKIGVSKDPRKRLKSIKHSMPFAILEEVASQEAACRMVAGYCEHFMLFACRHLSMGGEWLCRHKGLKH